MYNLSHLYIYMYENKLDKSIELLIKTLGKGFSLSLNLLCISLIKKIGFNIDIEKIQKEITKFSNESKKISKLIYQEIQDFNLKNKSIFEIYYNSFKTCDFIYDYKRNYISTNYLEVNKEHQELATKKNINSDFKNNN